MSDQKHTYLQADAEPTSEIMRLRDIDRLMAPTTERRIEHLGVARGWKCLEVGAGVGGVARWMAGRVGLEGKVTAIDVKPMFEEDAGLPHLEIRRHDILEEGLEPDLYDLAHCRLLLTNVGNVELALKHMTEALRPGGWLIVEEPGESRFPAVGEANPMVAEFNQLMDLFLQALQSRTKAVDLGLYRRLPGLMEEAGLRAIAGEVTSQFGAIRGRAPLLGTLQSVRPLLAESSFAKEGKLGRLVDLASDVNLLTMGGSTVCLWGQRPA